MITIDGSAGEGGGQVLRTALGLSLVTGRSFQINNIRGKRKKPGLLRQHLTAVLAAGEIGQASVSEAAIKSATLCFEPGTIKPGNYHFSIGTAGSCVLVFQAIMPALLMASSPSKITLEGGTHNPFAPSFDYLKGTLLPLLQKMGADVVAELDRPGFYPAGGGKMTITVKPSNRLLRHTLFRPGVKKSRTHACIEGGIHDVRAYVRRSDVKPPKHNERGMNKYSGS